MSDTTDKGTPILEFRNINTHYGAVHILKDVNLAIYPGEMVSLLGGNASGKSTTLKTLLGMVTPTTGASPPLLYAPDRSSSRCWSSVP